MADAADRLRAQHFLKSDYTMSPDADPDSRVANAMDYIAYHMGQIDKKLDDVIKVLETIIGRKTPLG
jgi:hypothetical protein